MRILRGILLIVLLAPVGTVVAAAQDCGPQNRENCGSLEVSARIPIPGREKVNADGTKSADPAKLKRKRFYLFRGGFEANRPLMGRLNTPAITRDCFYCKMNASPEYVAWLKSKSPDQDCESPYCREITTDDIAKVPEFQAAYKKGLEEYPGKPDLARKWLTTNLAPELRDGYYRQRKSLVETILGGIEPLRSVMTDSITVKAVFTDIPVRIAPAAKPAKKTETFLVTNLVPVEIDKNSYIWACEVEIAAAKNTLPTFPAPEKSSRVKNCEVIVRPLPVCSSGNCNQ